MRAAVVGHVEWIEFVPVEECRGRARSSHADESWEEAGRRRVGRGGPALEARGLGATSSPLSATTSSAERARERARGARGHGACDARSTRRSGAASRTSTMPASGRSRRSAGSSHPRGHDDSLPWHELARCDAVYFCAGDADALLLARRARVLVATARELATLRAGIRRARRARRRAGRTRRSGTSPGRLDPGAAARRHDVGRARRLGAARRPVQRRAAPVRDPADAYGAATASPPGLSFALARRPRGPGRARVRLPLRRRGARRAGRARGGGPA